MHMEVELPQKWAAHPCTQGRTSDRARVGSEGQDCQWTGERETRQLRERACAPQSQMGSPPSRIDPNSNCTDPDCCWSLPAAGSLDACLSRSNEAKCPLLWYGIFSELRVQGSRLGSTIEVSAACLSVRPSLPSSFGRSAPGWDALAGGRVLGVDYCRSRYLSA